jgi:hypothetical protein
VNIIGLAACVNENATPGSGVSRISKRDVWCV